MADVSFIELESDIRRLWFKIRGRVKPSVGCSYRRCITLFLTCDKCKYNI